MSSNIRNVFVQIDIFFMKKSQISMDKYFGTQNSQRYKSQKKEELIWLNVHIKTVCT